MSSLDAWSRWCADLETDPDPDHESYIPEITGRGSTRPFRGIPVANARPAPSPRPGPDADRGALLVGIAYGLALSVPLWLLLAVATLWALGS